MLISYSSFRDDRCPGIMPILGRQDDHSWPRARYRSSQNSWVKRPVKVIASLPLLWMACDLGSSDGVSRVLGDEVGVDGRPGPGARIGGTDDPRDEVGHVPGHPDTGGGGEPGGVGVDVLAHAEGMDGRLEAEAGEHLGAGHEAWHERHGPTRDDLAAAHLDAREAVLDDLERRDLPVHDRDATCGQLLRLRIGGLRCGVQEQRQVCRPLAEQQRLMRGPRIRCQNPYRLIAGTPTRGSTGNAARRAPSAPGPPERLAARRPNRPVRARTR
jgi:hypothetical protein